MAPALEHYEPVLQIPAPLFDLERLPAVQPRRLLNIQQHMHQLELNAGSVLVRAEVEGVDLVLDWSDHMLPVETRLGFTWDIDSVLFTSEILNLEVDVDIYPCPKFFEAIKTANQVKWTMPDEGIVQISTIPNIYFAQAP